MSGRITAIRGSSHKKCRKGMISMMPIDKRRAVKQVMLAAALMIPVFLSIQILFARCKGKRST